MVCGCYSKAVKLTTNMDNELSSRPVRWMMDECLGETRYAGPVGNTAVYLHIARAGVTSTNTVVTY